MQIARVRRMDALFALLHVPLENLYMPCACIKTLYTYLISKLDMYIQIYSLIRPFTQLRRPHFAFPKQPMTMHRDDDSWRGSALLPRVPVLSSESPRVEQTRARNMPLQLNRAHACHNPMGKDKAVVQVL